MLLLESFVIASRKYNKGKHSFEAYWNKISMVEINNFASKASIKADHMFINCVANNEDYVPEILNLRYIDLIGEIDDKIISKIEKEEFYMYLEKKTSTFKEDEKLATKYILLGISNSEICARLSWSKRKYYLFRNKLKRTLDFEIIKKYFK